MGTMLVIKGLMGIYCVVKVYFTFVLFLIFEEDELPSTIMVHSVDMDLLPCLVKEGDCIIHRAGKKGKISYGWLYVGMHGYIDRRVSLFCWSFILNTCKHVLYEENFCSFIIDIPF
ncbi:uncharacterized protein [Malus domestica]|uniref:uncharacterized protein n=1 Tax=Malus domestica TaxID=3750 RepID=UPI0039749D99